jgi:hypothetical protein
MNMPLLRARSGTKVMPVMANIHPAPRFSRRPLALAGLGRLGASAAGLLVQPGPGGGTQVVDASGNVIYSAAYVAANPSILSSIAATGVCPGGLMPTYFPGGESVCAGTETIAGGSNTPAAQFNYPVGGACPVQGWCFTGSSMTDPGSFTWMGGGTPTSPNPASIYSAAPLPSVYTTPQTPAQTLAIEDCTAEDYQAGLCAPTYTAAASKTVTPAPTPTVVANPAVANVITPPTGQPVVTPAAIAATSNQTGNQNANISKSGNTSTNAGSGSGSGSGSTSSNALSQAESQLESATGLSGSTLLLIAAGLVVFMMVKK